MIRLIESILRGDKQAAATFYRMYSPQIRAYLSHKVSCLQDLQELLEDIFVDAFQGLSLFEEKSSLPTWLFRIAHNKLVDYYRKTKNTTILLFSQIPTVEFAGPETNQPEIILETHWTKEVYLKARSHLSQKYQRVLQMRYEYGLPLKTIAKRLHASFKATESLLFRSRKKLQSLYQDAERGVVFKSSHLPRKQWS